MEGNRTGLREDFCPAVTRAQPPALPRNSNGRLGFPGPTQEEARNPLRNSILL